MPEATGPLPWPKTDMKNKFIGILPIIGKMLREGISLDPRGLISVEAQGGTWSARWHFEIMKVMRALVTLRLLCQDMEEVEEVCAINT